MRKLILALFLMGVAANGQNDIPKNYFNNPIEIPLILSGSFGELRSNHFQFGHVPEYHSNR